MRSTHPDVPGPWSPSGSLSDFQRFDSSTHLDTPGPRSPHGSNLDFVTACVAPSQNREALWLPTTFPGSIDYSHKLKLLFPFL